MTTEAPAPKPQPTVVKNIYRQGGNAVYGLGLIGAAVYYIQHATTFTMGLLGVVKAIVWPAIVLYRLLDFLNL
jgi:hypothetical protein